MSREIERLRARIVKLEENEAEHQAVQAALKERVKELNCLYGFAEIIEREGSTLPGIYRGLVEIIPPGWQYPKHTCARLTMHGVIYASPGFRRTSWRQAAPVRITDSIVGTLEVCYLQEFPELDEGPFLNEERNLINDLGERLGRVVERYEWESELKKSKNLLEIQKIELERKNAALQELLMQLEVERNKMESNIKANIDMILNPIVEEMRNHVDESTYLDILHSGLNDLTSSFAATLKTDFSVLSPRELEICHMVKSGVTSKEIASVIGISPQTVEKHRARIRKKLGICGEKTNLISFLQSL